MVFTPIINKISRGLEFQFEEQEHRLINRLFPLPYLLLLSHVSYYSGRPSLTVSLGLAYLAFYFLSAKLTIRFASLRRALIQCLRFCILSLPLLLIIHYSGKHGNPWLLSIFMYIGAPFTLPPLLFFSFAGIFTLLLLAVSYQIGYNTEELLFIFIVLISLSHLFGVMVFYLKNRNLRLRNTTDNLKKAARVRSKFLATVSHEIRTPMNAILGSVELLHGTPLNANQKSTVHMIENAGEHLLGLIDGVLALSKIDSGKLNVRNIFFDLRKSFQDIESLVRHTLLKDKSVRIRTDIASDIPYHFNGDPGKIKQILLNLATNAARFTASGEIVLGCQWENIDEHLLRISVADTGHGVSTGKQKKIFRAFEQEQTGTTREYGGFGLGLSICRKIVHDLGGTMWMESEMGSGSVFSFSLPLPPCEEWDENRKSGILDFLCADCPKNPDNRGASVESSGSIAEIKEGSVLLVDDDELNLIILRELLKNGGFSRIVLAQSGREALERMEEQKFDFVVLDIHMPGMDGCIVAEKIRRMQDQNAEAVIIACSADTSDENINCCYQAGMDGFICKPVEIEELIHKMGRLAEARGQERISEQTSPPQAGP